MKKKCLYLWILFLCSGWIHLQAQRDLSPEFKNFKETKQSLSSYKSANENYVDNKALNGSLKAAQEEGETPPPFPGDPGMETPISNGWAIMLALSGAYVLFIVGKKLKKEIV
jgi:hypothetical protein